MVYSFTISFVFEYQCLFFVIGSMIIVENICYLLLLLSSVSILFNSTAKCTPIFTFRRWFVLEGNRLSFWKYPDNQKTEGNDLSRGVYFDQLRFIFPPANIDAAGGRGEPQKRRF